MGMLPEYFFWRDGIDDINVNADCANDMPKALS